MSQTVTVTGLKELEQSLSQLQGKVAKKALEIAVKSGTKVVLEEAKARATEEGNKIVAAARAEAEQQAIAAREALREQVAALAVKGAEQILRKEVNAGAHADLLSRLKTEL